MKPSPPSLDCGARSFPNAPPSREAKREAAYFAQFEGPAGGRLKWLRAKLRALSQGLTKRRR